MSIPNSRNRPSITAETAPESDQASPDQSTGKPVAVRLDRDEVLEAIPAYVVILKNAEGTIRRRVFLSLHSAVRAHERARARGHAASLELVEYVSRGDR